MDFLTYGALMAMIESVQSGFLSATKTDDNTFDINFIDGSKIPITISVPAGQTLNKEDVEELISQSQISLDSIDKQIADYFAKNKLEWTVSNEMIATAVKEYMKEHPASAEGIEVDESYFIYNETVAQTSPAKPCTEIRVASTSVSLNVNEVKNLGIAVVPADTTDEIIYRITSEDVIKCEKGMITALKEGISQIYVSCGSQTITISIKVVAEKIEPGEIFISDFDFSDTSKYAMNAYYGTDGTFVTDGNAYGGSNRCMAVAEKIKVNPGEVYTLKQENIKEIGPQVLYTVIGFDSKGTARTMSPKTASLKLVNDKYYGEIEITINANTASLAIHASGYPNYTADQLKEIVENGSIKFSIMRKEV